MAKFVLDSYGHEPTRARHPNCSCKVPCGRSSRFKCSVCKTMQPWCFGAADDMPDACDACWCDLTDIREAS